MRLTQPFAFCVILCISCGNTNTTESKIEKINVRLHDLDLIIKTFQDQVKLNPVKYFRYLDSSQKYMNEYDSLMKIRDSLKEQIEPK